MSDNRLPVNAAPQLGLHRLRVERHAVGVAGDVDIVAQPEHVEERVEHLRVDQQPRVEFYEHAFDSAKLNDPRYRARDWVGPNKRQWPAIHNIVKAVGRLHGLEFRAPRHAARKNALATHEKLGSQITVGVLARVRNAADNKICKQLARATVVAPMQAREWAQLHYIEAGSIEAGQRVAQRRLERARRPRVAAATAHALSCYSCSGGGGGGSGGDGGFFQFFGGR